MSDVRVFAAPELQKLPKFQSFISEFKLYKQSGVNRFSSFKFGKDVPYHRPESAVAAELKHVHIVPIKSELNTSDKFAIYSQGFTEPNNYLVISIIENAHELSNNTLLMAKYAEIAEQFRSLY